MNAKYEALDQLKLIDQVFDNESYIERFKFHFSKVDPRYFYIPFNKIKEA